jgi:hypothetical protein
MSKAIVNSNNVSSSGFVTKNKKFERPDFKEEYSVIQQKRENVAEALKKIVRFIFLFLMNKNNFFFNKLYIVGRESFLKKFNNVVKFKHVI